MHQLKLDVQYWAHFFPYRNLYVLIYLPTYCSFLDSGKSFIQKKIDCLNFEFWLSNLQILDRILQIIVIAYTLCNRYYRLDLQFKSDENIIWHKEGFSDFNHFSDQITSVLVDIVIKLAGEYLFSAIHRVHLTLEKWNEIFVSV